MCRRLGETCRAVLGRRRTGEATDGQRTSLRACPEPCPELRRRVAEGLRGGDLTSDLTSSTIQRDDLFLTTYGNARRDPQSGRVQSVSKLRT
jgi:hypothetical protein